MSKPETETPKVTEPQKEKSSRSDRLKWAALKVGIYAIPVLMGATSMAVNGKMTKMQFETAKLNLETAKLNHPSSQA